MLQAVRGFTSWIFTTRPEIVRVEAAVFERNTGSEIVLQQNGYVKDDALSRLKTKAGLIFKLRMYAARRRDQAITSV